MGRVVVAGSINMDVVATAERHPRLGETVAGTEVLYFPGGKGANQAVAAARLGAPTSLIGRIGKDAFGEALRSFLACQGVDASKVQDTGKAHSGTAIITLAGADNTIVVIPGANALLDRADVESATLAKGDVAVSQFEIPLPTIAAFFRQARAAGATTILNPAPAQPAGRDLLGLADILVLNETELALLSRQALCETDSTTRFGDAARCLRSHPAQIICITLGRRGVLAFHGDEMLTVPGRMVKAVDTTGAGDCLVGALAAQLASGASIDDALAYANKAAAISVQRMGGAPSMPTAAEVEGSRAAS